MEYVKQGVQGEQRPVFNSLKGGYGNFLELDDTEKKIINEDIFHFIINWGDTDFPEGKIRDLLNIDNYQLWYYQRFRVYFELRNIFYEIAMLKKLESLGFHTVYLHSTFHYDRSSFISNLKIIEKEDKQNTLAIKKTYLLVYGFIFAWRALIGKFRLFFNRDKRHLFLNSAIEQSVVKSDGEIKKDNPILSYLFDELQNEDLILKEMLPPKGNQDLKSLKRYLSSSRKNVAEIPAESIFLEVILRKSLRKKYKKIYVQAKQKLEGLGKETSDPTQLLVLNLLWNYRSSNKYYILRFVGYQHFFESNKLKSVTATDENGPLARSVLDAAKICKLKTFGVQHGAVHNLHPNYKFNKSDYNQMPDYTFVWGEKWKDLLITNGGYDHHKIRVTGQIRTDIIPHLKRTSRKSKKLQIVFASQPQRDAYLREQTARDIFKAVNKLSYVSLKVKLHPVEQNDIAYYEKIAKQEGLFDLEFLNDAELYLVINQADVMITSFSTVGTEAIYFHKPLIIYDPLKQDLQSYCSEGVGLPSVNSQDIYKLLKEMQQDAYVPNNNKYEVFIKENAYKIDGKASDRTLAYINELS